MKFNNFNLKFKLLIAMLFSLMLSSNTNAQMTGSSTNGRSASSEANVTDITEGGFSGDVSLFSGTFNSSYKLGTVSTASGLSFTANLSYASTMAASDNMANLSGVPYGEGWKLELPTISVSTEDYNKFTADGLFDISKKANDPPPVNMRTPTFLIDEAKEEGRLYWYAPTLSIPGVASGRMVYKGKEGEDFVFLLNRFQKYIEARLNVTTRTWKVTTDDGTIYEFGLKMLSHRQASNQRLNRHEDDLSVANAVLPKTEYSTWYCDRITHPNHVGSIQFEYTKFGKFDFFQPVSFVGGSRLGSPSKGLELSYRDIFIKKIYSEVNQLEFNYNSLSTVGFPKLPQTNTLLDALYEKISVQKFNLSSNADANTWTRYSHIRADNAVLGCKSTTANFDMGFLSSTNPYIGSASGTNLAVQPGNYYIKNGGLLATTTKSGNPYLAFKHGFLESPGIIRGNAFSSELHELAIEYEPGNNDVLYDVNISTGDHGLNSGMDISDNNRKLRLSGCLDKIKGEKIFSTHGQAIKTVVLSSDEGAKNAFSYFFQMPNLSLAHTNLYIQVGPANGDMNVQSAPGLNGTPHLPTVGDAAIAELVRVPFNADPKNIFDTDQRAPFRSGDALGNHFGLGMPWWMLRKKYVGSSLDIMDANCSQRLWWSNHKNEAGVIKSSCSPFGTFSNAPTWADQTTGIRSVELFRWAKKPYVLDNVVFSVKNQDAPTNPVIPATMVAVNKKRLQYQISMTANYANAYIPELLTGTASLDASRHVILLTNIYEVPVTGTVTTDVQPTTTFCYVNKIFTATGAGSCSGFFLSEINNPLGQRTFISYADMDGTLYTREQSITIPNGTKSFQVSNYRMVLRPSELVGPASFSLPTCKDNVTYTTQLSRSFSTQIFMVVASKRVQDRNNTERLWNYKFENFSYNNTDKTPISPNLSFDYIDNGTVGGFGNLKVSEGIITATHTTSPITTMNGAVTLYTHSKDKKLWGQLLEIEQKTAMGIKVSKKMMTYSAVLAFKPNFTTQTVHPDFPTSYNSNNYDTPRFLESRGGATYGGFINTGNPDYLSSFFIKLDQEVNINYEASNTFPDEEIVTVTEYQYYGRVQSSSGIFYPIVYNVTPTTIEVPSRWAVVCTKRTKKNDNALD